MIDLQWFASAEEEDRTEQPSEHKLRKAREEGRIPKSQELTSGLVMLLVILCLVLLGSWIFSGCIDVIVFYLSHCTDTELTDPVVGKVFLQFFMKTIVPLAITALIAALAGNIIQNKGFIFTTKTITPKFNKLIPKFGEYFKKTLFSMEGLFNVAKSLMKVAAVFIAAWIIIKNDLPTLLSMMNVNLWNGMVYLGGMVIKLLLVAAVIFLVVAIPDYFVQRHQFMESMKMTKQEVKEEFKELEGDPLVKGRLKSYIREMMSMNMRDNVAKADVVITNPTHYAVALQYDRDTMPAPMVTAKGVDSVAQRIKQIARENDVEIVENKPLARALYAEVEIGDIIPEQYYQALSIILMRVYKIKAKRF
ncbi:MAG: flagellar biosynthesis protein FlhB [Spirochaetaceae bacterium]|nr:flagellar biosynthesis protein FlhB [Spirochaetaceae bacterium]